MDKMAYLQQIASERNNQGQQTSNKNKIFLKFLNKKIIIGVIAVIGVIIAINSIVKHSSLSKIDKKDQNLIVKSYYAAHYLADKSLDNYVDMIKNSDIRNMSASLKSVLNEILVNGRDLLANEYGVGVGELESGEIASTELATNEKLNTVLEEGRLNGILDRTFVREMTMQIAYLISYQSECSERTKNEKVKTFVIKVESNLQNLYNQFHSFKSLAI